MQNTVFIAILCFFCGQVSSQKRYDSVSEVGKRKIAPTEAMKQDVLQRGAPAQYVVDEQFFDLKKGRISFGSYIESLYFRVIYTNEGDWIETQELHHCDVGEDALYYEVFPVIRQAVAGQYYINDCMNFVKISQADGYWYEIKAYRAADSLQAIYLINGNGYWKDLADLAQTLIFDEKLQFVKEKERKKKTAQSPYRWEFSVGKEPYKPSANLKRDALAMGADTGMVQREYFFLLDNGLVSLGKEVEEYGSRLLYDADDNWIETQQLFYCADSQQYQPYFDKMCRAAAATHRIEPCTRFMKVTNMRNYWYEVRGYRRSDSLTLLCNKIHDYATPDTFGRILVFDTELRFVGEKERERVGTKMYKSVAEKAARNIVPTEFLRRDVVARGARKEDVIDERFYRTGKGLISFGKSPKALGLRIFYDANQCWLETQELLHCGMQPPSEYHYFLPKMQKAIEGKYYICDCANILKISHAEGYWYEVTGYLLKDAPEMKRRLAAQGYCDNKKVKELRLFFDAQGQLSTYQD